MIVTSAEMVTWLVSLVIAAMVQRLRAAEFDETTPSLLRRLCTANKCRNGECYLVNESTRCVCDRIYKGDHCEEVNMAEVQFAIIGNIVIFQWTRPPRLKGYSFVYY